MQLNRCRPPTYLQPDNHTNTHTHTPLTNACARTHTHKHKEREKHRQIDIKVPREEQHKQLDRLTDTQTARLKAINRKRERSRQMYCNTSKLTVAWKAE